MINSLVMMQWDKKLFLYLNNLGREKWDPFWLYITSTENWIPFYIVMSFLFLYLFGLKKSLFLGLNLIVMMLFVYGFSLFLKQLFTRPRPCMTLADVETIRILTTNCKKFSFPSNHACLHFALAIFLGKALKGYGIYIPILFLLWAVLIAYSRIYIGAHYPSDVLIGSMIGIFFGFLFFHFYKKWVLKFV